MVMTGSVMHLLTTIFWVCKGAYYKEQLVRFVNLSILSSLRITVVFGSVSAVSVGKELGR